MKIAAAQINPRVGDIKFNLALILKQIDLAKSKGVQLIVFPELAILGYPPRDLLSYSHLIDENLEALQKIKQHSQGISVVVGYVERNPSPLGKPYFNSAAVFQNGNLIKNYRKKLLPSYDVFEEERYFQPGELGAVFEIQNKKIGLTICEDVWNEPGFIEREYDLKPLEDFKDVDLDLLVNLSASPFQLGKKEIRDQLFQLVSKKIGCPLVFCNQVGANDELIFDGGSFVMAPHGKCVVAQDFQSELLIWDEQAQQPSVLLPLRTESQTLIEALSLGIRDYVEKSGARTVCLGLSGGIDSSVVAALAVKALGPNRVYGFTLPSRFNASQSLEDAEKLAANLGISCRNLAIEPIFQVFERVVTQAIGNNPKTLTLENIQPRIRMTLLMALANEAGHLLLNTSNKSEIFAGYATLYGDTAGAISVLGDLTKHQVYLLAQEFNCPKEVIPQRVISRAPSAELRENQTDQDSLPPYDILDSLVKNHMEKTQPLQRLSSPQISQETIEKISKLNAFSEYKRRQLPPALRVTSKAFGMGRRMPVVGRKSSE